MCSFSEPSNQAGSFVLEVGGMRQPFDVIHIGDATMITQVRLRKPRGLRVFSWQSGNDRQRGDAWRAPWAIMASRITRRGVRVVDCAVLERPSVLKAQRGFESLPLRSLLRH